MATHRRGSRSSQWPVRDLLRDQGSRVGGGLRDPRLYAAVGGLLACSAAATVAFTAGDGPNGGTGPGGGSGPMASPAPSMVVPAPADPGTLGPGAANPVPRVPPTPHAPRGAARHAADAPARTVPVPRAWQRPADERTTSTRDGMREVLDRVEERLAAIRERAGETGATEGVVLVPVPRADVAALVERADVDCARAADRDDGAADRADENHEQVDDEADDDADDEHDADDEDDDDRDDDRDDDERRRPALALLVTASPHGDGALAARDVDPDTVLAALADLDRSGA